MPDFTFKADPRAQFVKWTDPERWSTGVVPNSADAVVSIPRVTSLPTGSTYSSGIAIGATEAITVQSLNIVDNSLYQMSGSLTVGTTLTLSGQASVSINSGTLSAKTIDNGYQIDGKGTVNAESFNNQTGALLGGQNLTVTSHNFVNNGLITGGSGNASAGTLTINTDAGQFSGIVNGDLHNGTYIANDNIIINSNQLISSISTSVQLHGSTIYSQDPSTGQSIALQSSLQEIAAAGSLSLSAAPSSSSGGTFEFNDLSVAGSLSLTGVPFTSNMILNAHSLHIAPGGTLTGSGIVNASIQNEGTIKSESGTLILEQAVNGGGRIVLDGSDGSINTTVDIGGASDQTVIFEKSEDRLILSDPTKFSGSITPSLVHNHNEVIPIYETAHNTITVNGIAFDSASLSYSGNSSGGTLTVNDAAHSVTLHINGNFNSNYFQLTDGRTLSSDPAAVNIIVNLVCFAAGTRIRTFRGDVAIEDLRVGDIVPTSSGIDRKVVWLGSRTVQPNGRNDCDWWPVRIAANAFAPGQPSRDLLVSPGHALCVDVVDEVLIPAIRLVNGSTICQVPVDSVTYWHVELDSHDVVFANDLRTESYMDVGNRRWFDGDDAVPVDSVAMEDGLGRYARPLIQDGPIVRAVRDRLVARAQAAGWTLSEDMDIHLMVDGTRVEGDFDQNMARFIFPASARRVSVTSETFLPTAHGSHDDRHLGICLSSLSIGDGLRNDQSLSLDHAAFASPYALESEGDMQWRWTDGDLKLPASLWQDCRSHVILRMEMRTELARRWVAPQSKRTGSLPGNVVALRL